MMLFVSQILNVSKKQKSRFDTDFTVVPHGLLIGVSPAAGILFWEKISAHHAQPHELLGLRRAMLLDGLDAGPGVV